MSSTAQPVREATHARLARNGLVSLVAQALRFGLYFCAAIVLARRLAPDDFGIFAIAFAVTGFLEIARDGGLVVPVVQADHLTEDQRSALFGVNVAAGIALTAISFLAAPFVSGVYRDPRLIAIIRVLAFTFLIGGLSTQHRALLRRESRFAALGICETAALAAGCVAAVFSAVRGGGVWSLVWLYVTLELTQTVLTTAVSGWRPGFPRRGAPVGALIRFGGIMMAFEFLGYVNLKLDNLIVGWYLGPVALGFYDKAYQLLLLPVNQIGLPVSGVAHSALSRARRSPQQYRDIFDRLLLLTTALGMPLTAFLYGNIHEVVAVVLGPKWLPSVPVFRALAPAAFLMTVTAGMGWIFNSLGRAGRQFSWSFLTTAATVVAYFIGVRRGIVGVAWGVSITRILLFLPTLQYTCAGSPIRWTGILRIAARPALASIVALGVSMLAAGTLGNGLLALAENAVLFSATYGIAWIVMPGGKSFLKQHLPSARMLGLR